MTPSTLLMSLHRVWATAILLTRANLESSMTSRLPPLGLRQIERVFLRAPLFYNKRYLPRDRQALSLLMNLQQAQSVQKLPRLDCRELVP